MTKSNGIIEIEAGDSTADSIHHGDSPPNCTPSLMPVGSWVRLKGRRKRRQEMELASLLTCGALRDSALHAGCRDVGIVPLHE